VLERERKTMRVSLEILCVSVETKTVCVYVRQRESVCVYLRERERMYRERECVWCESKNESERVYVYVS
jgi:hypothetical protein